MVKLIFSKRCPKHYLCLFFCLAVAVLLMLPACGSHPGKCSVPLDIDNPVYAGTEVVAYRNGTKGCPVLIYADGKPVGTDSIVSPVGHGEVMLNRALQKGELITARQDPNGDSTWPQKAPAVEKIPSALLINGEKFNPPVVVPPLIDCQKGLRVEKLVEGVRASVSGRPVALPKKPSQGSAWTPFQSTFVGVDEALREGDQITSWQDMLLNFPRASDKSNPPENVQGLPDRLPIPLIVEDVGEDGVADTLVGSEVITVSDLVVGAWLVVYAVDPQNNTQPVGSGIATADRNWISVPPLEKDNKYCVQQSLCTLKSPEQQGCISPENSINIPLIREPLCPGDIDVKVDKTAFGASVFMRINGVDNSSATAPGPTTVLNVSGGIPLKSGDEVTVWQTNPSLVSGWNTASVKTKQECEVLTKPEDPEPDPTEPAACVPGKGKFTLFRLIDNCPTGLVEAYHGTIPAINGGVLYKITNNTSWKVKIVESHNSSGQMGTFSCEKNGGYCTNVDELASLSSGEPWSNIRYPKMNAGVSISACIVPGSGTPPDFPFTIDLEYEYTCE